MNIRRIISSVVAVIMREYARHRSIHSADVPKRTLGSAQNERCTVMVLRIFQRRHPISLEKCHVAWLQGATARNLKYDIQGTFISTPTVFSNFKNFVFDDPSQVFNSEMSKLISGVTNASGDATVQTRFDIGSSAPGMLLGNFVTRVFEESGDYSVDGMRLLYSPYNRFAGIRPPQSSREQLNTGQNYNYQVASVDYLGRPVGGSDLEVSVYKIEWYWWWNSDNSQLANFVSDTYNKPVKTMTLRTAANGLASFPLSFSDKEWGSYFIRVKDKSSNHSTGVVSYFDWPYQEGRRNADGSMIPYSLCSSLLQEFLSRSL